MGQVTSGWLVRYCVLRMGENRKEEMDSDWLGMWVNYFTSLLAYICEVMYVSMYSCGCGS